MGIQLPDFVTGKEGGFFSIESRTICGILEILLIDLTRGSMCVMEQWFLRQLAGHLDGITRNCSSIL